MAQYQLQGLELVFAPSEDSVLLFGGADRSNEGGLNARADLWELKLDCAAGTASWALVLDDDGDSADCGLPPSRNAATFCEVNPPPLLLESSQANDGDPVRYFVLQGGWSPFRKTWAETAFLRVEIGDD